MPLGAMMQIFCPPSQWKGFGTSPANHGPTTRRWGRKKCNIIFFDGAGSQGAKRVDLALTRKDWSAMTQLSSGLAAEHETETGLGTHVDMRALVKTYNNQSQFPLDMEILHHFRERHAFPGVSHYHTIFLLLIPLSYHREVEKKHTIIGMQGADLLLVHQQFFFIIIPLFFQIGHFGN
jgi:hypothetical protein